MKKNLFYKISLALSFILLFSCSEDENFMSSDPELNDALLLKTSATLNFSTTASGTNKSMNYWVHGTHSIQTAIDRLGANEIDVIRIGGFQKWALAGDNRSLRQETKDHLDGQIAKAINVLSINSNADISLCSSTQDGKVAPYFIKNGQARTTRWKKLFKAVREYLLQEFNNKGYYPSIAFIEANNEPDWNKIGDQANMNDMMQKMQNDGVLGSIPQVGPSTLSCAKANSWYEATKNNTDWGATHVLGGNMQKYIDFIKKINNQGKPFYNSEAHTVAEMIVAAQYGCKGGLWWYPVSGNEAAFTKAQYGKRICYKEIKANWAVAAGYKGSGNTIHLFASSAERFKPPSNSTFTFTCSDRKVSFDGSAKKYSHSVTIGKNETKHIVVTW